DFSMAARIGQRPGTFVARPRLPTGPGRAKGRAKRLAGGARSDVERKSSCPARCAVAGSAAAAQRDHLTDGRLEAVDWYRQRADDTEDAALRDILLHNMREEMEHASIVLELIRRHNSDCAGHLKTYLFTETPITGIEKAVEAADAVGGRPTSGSQPDGGGAVVAIGSLKGTR